MNRIVLGRGIGALIPDGTDDAQKSGQPAWTELPIAKIERNPDQPRQDMNPARLAELSESIRHDGVLQPILVRAAGDRYEVIAGERRLRAAQLAGLTTIPARVFENIGERERAVIALVENLQREDLNPLEEAGGYKEVLDRFGLSQEELASAVGKDRSTIANSLRLLNLPDVAQDAILKGELTAGHGRALLAASDPALVEKNTRRAIREGWSVRRLEKEISGNGKRRGRPIKALKTSRWSALEDALKRKYGTAVTISHRLGKGRVTFEYYSEEDLTRLIDLLGVRLD
jgi:ParB family chromosome partitioning protein